ncbi:MAG: hypothetical protein AMS17_20480 [Spirochaetes bacterium DG_61]|nr:MAG: hypothetical protein AMS17_20480 [Spirochaetes bacterium DG_61]
MVDMKKAADLFGDKMAICGKTDSNRLLFHGSSEEVALATRTMLEQMASVKSYIPTSSCGISSLTPPENIDTFTQMVRRFDT